MIPLYAQGMEITPIKGKNRFWAEAHFYYSTYFSFRQHKIKKNLNLFLPAQKGQPMKKQTFLKGSLILGISALTAKLLGALFKIPLTNLLGGTGMGYFSCAYGLFLPLYAVFVTGLSTAVARSVAACAASGDISGALRIRSVARRLFLVGGLAGTVFALLTARIFTLYTAESMEAYPAVLAIAPAVLFSCLTAVERGYHEGLCNMYPTAVSQAIEALCKLLCGLWLCHLILESPELPSFLSGISREGAAAAAAVLGVTLSTAAGWLCTLFFSRKRQCSVNSKVSGSSWKIVRMLLSVLIPVALGSLVTNLTSLIDLVTVMRCFNNLITENTAAFYEGASLAPDIPTEEAAAFVYGSYMGLSVTVFNLVPSLTNMFAKGVLPCTAQAWARGDRKEAAGYAAQVLILTGIAAIPAAGGIFVLSRGILEFLYAERPAEIAAACSGLQYLAAGLIFLCLSFPVFSLLQAIGRADLPVKIMAAGVAVKLLGNLLLIPLLYTAGAAVSTSLCYGVILILALIFLRRELKEPLAVGKAFLCMLYASAMCAAAAWLCYSRVLPHLPQRISLLAAVACGGVVYVLILGLSMGKDLRRLLGKGK